MTVATDMAETDRSERVDVNQIASPCANSVQLNNAMRRHTPEPWTNGEPKQSETPRVIMVAMVVDLTAIITYKSHRADSRDVQATDTPQRGPR